VRDHDRPPVVERLLASKTVIERYMAAVDAGDAAALRAGFAPDATWWLRGELPISGTWNGRDAIMDDFFGAHGHHVRRRGGLRACGQPYLKMPGGPVAARPHRREAPAHAHTDGH
jgi:SnoaL-like domain